LLPISIGWSIKQRGQSVSTLAEFSQLDLHLATLAPHKFCPDEIPERAIQLNQYFVRCPLRTPLCSGFSSGRHGAWKFALYEPEQRAYQTGGTVKTAK
jgi:hypothetical protein